MYVYLHVHAYVYVHVYVCYVCVCPAILIPPNQWHLNAIANTEPPKPQQRRVYTNRNLQRPGSSEPPLSPEYTFYGLPVCPLSGQGLMDISLPLVTSFR